MEDLKVKTPVPFRYTPLPNSKEFIRVLEVHPGKNHRSRLRLTMRDAPLETKYNCLSYTWGDGLPVCPIFINGQRFLVRHNLRTFLRRLRNRWTPSTLPIWIDAVTINQADVEEKNDQVSMMGQTYQRAERVIVWLGSGDQQVERAFRFVKQRTSVDYHGQETKCSLGRMPRDNQRNENIFKGLLSYMARVPLKEYWDAFDAISSLPYFRRLWIIQEILLAREIELWYGSHRVDEIALANLCHYIDMVFPAGVEDVMSYSRARSSFCGLTFLNRAHEKNGGRVTTDFRENFEAYRKHICQNPKDKVYGLISLCKEMEDFPVDYDADSERLVSDVFQRCEMDSNLGYLMIKELNLSHDKLFELTKEMFPDQEWGFEVADVGVIEDQFEIGSSFVFDVDWSDLALPDRPVGEYCQHLQQISISTTSNSSTTSEICTGDLLLRPPNLNIFFLFRAREDGKTTAVSSLVDEIFEHTPERVQMRQADAETLRLELADYSFVTAFMINEDQRCRVHEEFDESVGEEFTTPLKLEEHMDLMFIHEFQSFRVGASVRHFFLTCNWRCLLCLWKLQDHPGLVREDRVSDGEIRSWQRDMNITEVGSLDPAQQVGSCYWNKFTGKKELLQDYDNYKIVDTVRHGKQGQTVFFGRD